MSRLELPATPLTPAQDALRDEIVQGPRGEIAGLLNLWLNDPVFATPAHRLGLYARYDGKLSLREIEIAILVFAVHWQSGYILSIHKSWATKAGVEDDALAALLDGTKPALQDPADAAIYACARAVCEPEGLPDELFQQALAVLGRDRLFGLAGLYGYYSLVLASSRIFRP